MSSRLEMRILQEGRMATRLQDLERKLHQARVREAIATGKPMPSEPGRAPGTKPGVKPDSTPDEELDEDGNPIPSEDETDEMEAQWSDAVSRFGAVGANRRFPGLRARLVAAVNARHQRQVAVSRSGRRRRR